MRHHFEHGMHIRQVTPEGGGEGEGTLLYIHGLGESCLGFEGLMASPALASWRHLAADLPGYGKSPWPREPAGLEAQADLLAAWLEGRGAGPVVVLGHSMGGVLGLLLARRHPRRVRAFLNVEGNITLGDCHFSSKAARLLEGEFLAGGFETLREEVYVEGMKEHKRAWRGYYASLRLADPRLFHRHSRELVELSAREEMARWQSELEVPHLYLGGVPEGVAERSRELLRQAGVPRVMLEPAGHWPFLDQPERFAAAVVGFIGRLG